MNKEHLLSVIILFSTFQFGLSIKVIKSDPSKSMKKDGYVELQNTSTSSIEKMTLCARVMTNQFENIFSSFQVVILMEQSPLLASFTASNCSFAGCIAYWKALVGESWKYGKSYGFLGSHKFLFYPSWIPKVWNSICIVQDRKKRYQKYFANGIMIVETNEIIETQNRSSNILLMNGMMDSSQMDNGGMDSPMFGQVTDVNLWDTILSDQKISEWSKCKTTEGGNILNWKTVTFAVKGGNKGEIELLDMKLDSICLKSAATTRFFAYENTVESMKENQKFCRRLGAEVAVAKSSNDLMNHFRMVTKKGDCKELPWTFVGYVRKQQKWVDINHLESMTWSNFSTNYPIEAPGWDCTISANGMSMVNEKCDGYAFCPICQYTSSSSIIFQLSGVCLDIGVDTLYVFVNSTYLHGYINTFMKYSEENKRWEIINKRNSRVLALLNDTSLFPLGKNKWFFLESICQENLAEYRYLNLHLEVEQPGHFCCDDGYCIKSELVCDNVPHCKSKEDEQNCNMLSLAKEETDIPPFQVKENNDILKTEILASVTMIEVFDISEIESTFEVYFSLELKWKDIYMTYEFLKNDEDHNFIDINKTWTPKIEFFQMKKHFDFGTKVLVQKNESTKPILASEVDVLNAKEIYSGQEHFLKMITKKRAQFICSVDNIVYYPFRDQECSMGFYIQGTANKMTNMIPEAFTAPNISSVGQYMLTGWTYSQSTEESSGESRLVVTMVLSRRFYGIFMVTYLPTILMNIINQATNHITGDSKFDMIYTINITSMMVLASIYLSVSTSLPSTHTIKPVEWWLLVNLAYPFFIIITNIILQVIQILIYQI